MRIVSVNPTGVGPYQQAPSLTFEDGLTHLEGANGAGKTWIFNTITFVLYGRVESFAEGGVGNANDDVIHEGYSGCCPRVVFTDNVGRLWRVTYSRKWKGQSPYADDSPLYPFEGTRIYLERYTDGDWVDESSAEIPNTRKTILDIIQISYDRFIATTYLPQGRGFAFLRGSNAQRVQILSDVVGLSVWDDAIDRVKAAIDPLSEQRTSLVSKVTYIRGTLAGINLLDEQQRTTLAAGIVEAETELAHHREQEQHWHHQWSNQLSQLKAAEVGHSPAAAASAEIRQRWEPIIDEAYHRTHTTKTELAAALHTYYVTAANQYPDTPLVKELAALEASLADSTCPMCGQGVGQDLIRTKIDQLRVDIASAEQSQREAIARQITELANLDDAISTITVAHKKAEEDLSHARNAMASELEDIKVYNDIDQLRAATAMAQSKYDHHRQRQSQVIATLTAWKNQLTNADINAAHAQSLTAELNDIQDQLTTIEGELAQWTWLKQNLGERGCKAWQIESAVMRLNQILSSVLANLDPNLKVALTTKKTSSKGVVSQDIGISVSDATKKNVPVYLYSGGETSLIAFGLLVALWYLADEFSNGCGLLLLDEVVSALDDHNATIATMFLENLRAPNRTVIIISHAQCVDQLNFDHRIRVTKHEGVSTLEYQ